MISAVFGDETINVSPSGLSTQPPGAGKGSLVESVSSSLTSTWARAGMAERVSKRGAITAGRMNEVLRIREEAGHDGQELPSLACFADAIILTLRIAIDLRTGIKRVHRAVRTDRRKPSSGQDLGCAWDPSMPMASTGHSSRAARQAACWA